MTLDIRKLLKAGHLALAEEHATAAAEKVGHPRIGSSGIVAADGEIYGTCHRKAMARSLGIESPQALSMDIMWKAGEANEWHWERILGKGYKTGRLLRHDEVPVRAAISGVPLELLGHPDVVLAAQDGTPIMGLELKGLFGDSTVVAIELMGIPKNENLVQAAAYSYFRQLPYALCYTRASYTTLNFYDQKTYGVKSIPPFYRIFYMEWRNEVLWYRDERKTEWVQTNITPQGIEDYYRLVEEMKVKKELGPRVSSNYVHGKPDKWGPHGACGLCEFKTACDAYDRDKNYDEWLETIDLLSREKELLSE